jgi:xeroderma pigmentosum group C-complementing protein
MPSAPLVCTDATTVKDMTSSSNGASKVVAHRARTGTSIQQACNGKKYETRERLAVLLDKREEAELEQRSLQERQTLPKTMEGFKRSVVYILERHISRYQGLAPGAKPLGFHRGERYYDRSCLHELHSSERWRREGREVLAEELPTPHKVVKQRGTGKGTPSNAGHAREGDVCSFVLFF